MSLVGHWEEAKFPAGINLVQTMAPGWRQIVSEVALDLITIPAVSALVYETNFHKIALYPPWAGRGYQAPPQNAPLPLCLLQSLLSCLTKY